MQQEKYLGFKNYIKLYIADKKEEAKKKVEEYISKHGKAPALLIIQVGDNFASNKYISGKIKDCNEVGITCEHKRFDESATEKDLIDYIEENKKNYNGIIVQLPIPKTMDIKNIIKVIPPELDVDGFRKDSPHIPCTPLGVYELLMKLYKNDKKLDGKNVVIIGRSDIVGKPMANLLIEKTDATVTVCNSHTRNLKDFVIRADIVIVAVGKAGFITGDMIKEGATVIDVGINRDENNKVCGDVDIKSLSDNISFITPVPGGVGLLTRTSILTALTK